MPAVQHVWQVTLTSSGLPWSGKNILKMKFFPGQGKVRKFCRCRWPGKFRKDLESQGKVRECENTLMCLSIGTPKNNKFSICSKWKIHYFLVSQDLGRFQPHYNVLEYWVT